MKCAICGKPLPKYGTIWEPAEGIYTHMNTRCPKSFDYPAHDELLPDCPEPHDLFEHRGVMYHGGIELIKTEDSDQCTA